MAGADGVLASMKPGSIWIDLTTNRKELVIDLAAGAPEGVNVVDSPVTGAVDGARNGKLTLFAGGDDASLDRIVAAQRGRQCKVHKRSRRQPPGIPTGRREPHSPALSALTGQCGAG